MLMELKQISKLAAKLERLKEERKHRNKNSPTDHAKNVPEKLTPPDTTKRGNKK